ncbi:MAG: flagellar hook-basal body complex protein FliE [Rhodomicrobium sp.]|jgi:flagellar hook-basal body complex protein FliE
MTIDSIGSLSSVGSLSLGKQRSASAAAAAPQDFASVLSDLASQAAATIKAGDATAVKGIQGQAPVQEVVQSVMRAQTSLQTALALRDKAVAAYQDLVKMTI